MNKFELKTLSNPYILLIFSALFFSSLTDQFLQKKVELLISSKSGLSSMIWVWGGLSIITAILFPLIISILCAFVLIPTDKKIKDFLGENFELGVIETLRAWGKTFLWSFVFLIPGVIKYINFILTPFVVMFSQKYKNGEVDALEYSTRISKHFWWSLKIWLGVFYLLVPIVFYFLFDEYRVFANHPVAASFIVLVETLIQLLFHFVILRLFIKYLNEVENGSYV